MNSVELIVAARARGLELRTQGDELVLRGRAAAMPPEFLAALRAQKSQLVVLVRQLEAGGTIFRVRHTEQRQGTAIM